MVKKLVALLGLVLLPAALPATSLAQDAKTFLATEEAPAKQADQVSRQYASSLRSFGRTPDYVDAGATIITQDINKAFYERRSLRRER